MSSHRRDLAFAALTLALFGAVTFAFPGFATPRNLAGLLDDTAILIMLALGQMLVILVRGIDLSIAANLALCGMIAAVFDRAWPEAGIAPVLALTLVSGAVLGAFNGLLVWKLRLPPIVVTLGTMSIYRGAIYLLSKGAWVNENEMSRDFLAFPRGEFLGLTLLSWLALVVAVAFVIGLRRSRVARDLYAAGGNPEAANYSGVDAGRMQFSYAAAAVERAEVPVPVAVTASPKR
jgi:rhamnose transport system permease protein